MLLASLLLATTVIAAPAKCADKHIQTKDGGLCLSSGGRFDQGAPLQLAPCVAGQKDQRFEWEPFTFDGAAAGVEYFLIRNDDGLCVTSHVPCHGYSFGAPVLGPCDFGEGCPGTNAWRPMWVKDGDNICMDPKQEGDTSALGPAGLCFSAKDLAAGTVIDLAKDFTGKPVAWKL